MFLDNQYWHRKRLNERKVIKPVLNANDASYNDGQEETQETQQFSFSEILGNIIEDV